MVHHRCMALSKLDQTSTATRFRQVGRKPILTPDDERQIVADYTEPGSKETAKTLAVRHGVSERHIYKVLARARGEGARPRSNGAEARPGVAVSQNDHTPGELGETKL